MRCGSNRHLRFDRRVVLILFELREAVEKWTRRFATLGARHDLAVARDRIVDAAGLLFELREAVEKWTRRFATLGARHDLAVARDRIVDAAELGVEPKGRWGIGLALQLLARRVDVIAIDVRIGEDVHELVRLE